jgi:hypothetical protein
MSTPELPLLPKIDRHPILFTSKQAYTADQMREMYRAGRLAGLEEAAKECERIFSAPEPDGCDGWESYATRPYLDCAAAIRSLKEKQG